jgi:hypothetical protein
MVFPILHSGNLQPAARGLDAASEALPSGTRNKSDHLLSSYPKQYEMTKRKIIRDVEMRKFFEQQPENASPFLEVPEF